MLLSTIEILSRFFFETNHLIYYLNGSEEDNYYWLSTDKISRVIHKLTRADKNLIKAKKRIREVRKNSDAIYKIAVIGASSAIGYPYHSKLAFSNLLRILLSHFFPGKKIIVYNLAVFAQTYNFGLKAAKDSMLLAPDLIIVYAGHNERYPHNLIQVHQQINRPNLIKFFDTISSFIEQYSVAYKWSLDQRDQLRDQKEIIIPSDFNPNNHLDEMMLNYKNITDDLVRTSKKNKVKLIFSTLVKNIRDYPPHYYEGPIDEAFSPLLPGTYKSMNEQEKNEPANIYRLARWYDQNENVLKANYFYNKTSDIVYGIGRIHSLLQDYIRNIHSESPYVKVVDSEKAVQKKFGNINIGSNAIIDWVHPNIETNYYIALSLFYEIRPLMEIRFKKQNLNTKSGAVPDLQTALSKTHPDSGKLQANGLVEGGFVNLNVSGPHTAKLLFLEGLKQGAEYDWRTKAWIGLAFIALHENNNAELLNAIARLKSFTKESIKNNLFHYRSTDQIKTIRLLLKISGIDYQ